jgi:hypothetical protein
MPIEFYVILVGVGVVALAWLLLRFGKIIARWTLILGVLAAVIALGLAALEHARATRTAVKAATVAGAGAAGMSVLAVILAILLACAVGVAGYFWLRVRRLERRTDWTPGPNAQWARTNAPPSSPLGGSEAWLPFLMGQVMALQQMLVGLFAAGGINRQRQPRQTWSVSQPTPHYDLPPPFPFAIDHQDEWEDWDEASWESDEILEGELWDE